MPRLLLFLLSSALLSFFSKAAELPKPNIIIILSDDMGFSDIGCYGSEIETPSLDALAAGGLRFTQFYNTARCCPTRASLLTGLYPHQTGVGHMMEDRGHDGYRGELNRLCVTIPEVLRPAGYRTYMAGKWHITRRTRAITEADRENWPLQRGFDRFYGTITGAGSFWDPAFLTRDNTPLSPFADPEYRPEQPYYYTDAITDHALRFVSEHREKSPDQPFFLYLAYTAAHWPMHARPEDIAKYRGRYDGGPGAVRSARYQKMASLGVISRDASANFPIPEEALKTDQPFADWNRQNMEVYAAMIDRMDQGIGRLVSLLHTTGQFDNTLLCFLQDNGGCAEDFGRNVMNPPKGDSPSLPSRPPEWLQEDITPDRTRDGYPVRRGKNVIPGGPDTYPTYGRTWATVSNTPLREYKHWTEEGGISTPLIVSWPAGMNPALKGGLNRTPSHLIDLMATCADVSHAPYPEVRDGNKIKPMEGISLRPAFSGQTLTRSSPLFWEHEGNRAIRDGPWKLVAKEGRPWELYNIDQDRSEQRNLAATEPGRVSAMSAQWDAYAARADVLPLGAWRRSEAGAKSAGHLNPLERFILKAGDRLDRSSSPAVANRPFRLEVRFDSPGNPAGVLVAQGGSAHGYTLYAEQDRLQFALRTSGRNAGVSLPLASGSHTVIAAVNSEGVLSLKLDDAPEARSGGGDLIKAMPVDGLDVGHDRAGLVGPYPKQNAFTGTVSQVQIQLLPPTHP